MPVLLCTCKHFSIPFHKFLAPFGLWKFVNVYTSFVYFCFFHFSCLLLFGFERIYKVNTCKKNIFQPFSSKILSFHEFKHKMLFKYLVAAKFFFYFSILARTFYPVGRCAVASNFTFQWNFVLFRHTFVLLNIFCLFFFGLKRTSF